jgi:hypothetical protein
MAISIFFLFGGELESNKQKKCAKTKGPHKEKVFQLSGPQLIEQGTTIPHIDH